MVGKEILPALTDQDLVSEIGNDSKFKIPALQMQVNNYVFCKKISSIKLHFIKVHYLFFKNQFITIRPNTNKLILVKKILQRSKRTGG